MRCIEKQMIPRKKRAPITFMQMKRQNDKCRSIHVRVCKMVVEVKCKQASI